MNWTSPLFSIRTLIAQRSQRGKEVVNRKRGITPSTALRLGKFFQVSAGFWLNLQMRWDLHKAQQSEGPDLKLIRDFREFEKTA